LLYHWESTAALSAVRDEQTAAPLALTGEGLWVCLLSSGSCTAALGEGAGALPALAPRPVEAGGLILSRAPLLLTPAGDCHLLCLLLTGTAPAQLLGGLPEQPFSARGETCPGAAELMGRLAGDEVREVIMGLPPSVEGDATSIYLARTLKPLGVRTTRLASGVPVGSKLEQADRQTIYRALEGRREM